MKRSPRKDYLKQAVKKRQAFLNAYENCGFLRHAAKDVGLPTHTIHFRWLSRIPEYAAEFDRVHQRVIEKLGPRAEAEFTSRAIEGVRSLVIHDGNPVEVWMDKFGEPQPAPEDPSKPGTLKRGLYWKVEKSDALLLKLLKRLYPTQYADKVEHTGKDGEKLVIEVIYKTANADSSD